MRETKISLLKTYRRRIYISPAHKHNSLYRQVCKRVLPNSVCYIIILRVCDESSGKGLMNVFIALFVCVRLKFLIFFPSRDISLSCLPELFITTTRINDDHVCVCVCVCYFRNSISYIISNIILFWIVIVL